MNVGRTNAIRNTFAVIEIDKFCDIISNFELVAHLNHFRNWRIIQLGDNEVASEFEWGFLGDSR